MGIEIERKFLVRGEGWKSQGDGGTRYRQGYLSVTPERTVRVRLAGNRGFLTIKGKPVGTARAEFEYEIPAADALTMLDTLCPPGQIDKIRHRVVVGGHVWEVDEFLGDNAGLVVAEIELSAEGEAFEMPDWAGEEVSGDVRYTNARLSQAPFASWDKP
ncbi:MAG: adenylate cyclase [Alphaproteobacteria bacterium CG_4_10_14_0_2_um_filter_63_37]|nr:MAG: adenylate cyclase [Proteobacteria bacterium CG1_02_64_396]PJA26057.1 MAG: adenylate cyclase [Alphaproteobacteria bacterium CG_4_10_14_0_2_um_filter_63_37]